MMPNTNAILEIVSQGGFLLLAALTGVGLVWHQYIRNSGAKAQSDHSATNTEATVKLFEHYKVELDSLRVRYSEDSSELRRRVEELEKSLSDTQSELSRVETLWKQSSAEEKRYRAAFSKLIMIHTTLTAAFRAEELALADISTLLRNAESQVNALISGLVRPPDTSDLAFSEEQDEDGNV